MTPSPTDLLRAAMSAYRGGRMAQAEGLCRAILGTEPADIGGLFLLAVLRMTAGDLAAAVLLFRSVLILNPAIADAYGNLAMIRRQQRRGAEAEALFDRAVALAPDNAGWRIGRSMLRLDRPAQAARDVQCALALEPASATALRGLGLAHRGSGDAAGAAIAFDRAFRIDPTLDLADAEAFACRLDAADWHEYEIRCQRLERRIDDGGAVLPLLTQWIGIDPARQRQAAETVFRQQVTPAAAPAFPAGDRGDGRLTIAYLSADFHEHATAYLTAELFEQHDRRQFRILAGCYSRDDDSPIRRRILGAVDGFQFLHDMSATQVADWARAQGIDILVDLKGFTAGARLDLLSRRMAPVQVAYLGYPGTMGGGPLDYVIGDPVVTPACDQPFFHEKIVILPDSYQVNDRHRPLPAGIGRAALGLPPSGIVLGALHPPRKLNPQIFGCWMRLMRAIPDACLYLHDPQRAAAPNLRRAAQTAGVDPGRLIFAGSASLTDHLARYRAIDLCLDSFPYTGHTTTSDALWMGVPVVTRRGDGFAARVSASLLRAVGLPEMVTDDLAGYEALALSLARDPQRLARLKAHLEAVRGTAPLFDTQRFTRHLETAYRMMWERHSAGLPPHGFSVPPQA